MELIRSLTPDLSGHGGIRVSGTAPEGGERRRNSLLSSNLSSFEPGHKVFDCLVLEVGAHIAGEGPISVTLLCCAETTESHPLSTKVFFSSKQSVDQKQILFYFLDVNIFSPPWGCYENQINQYHLCACVINNNHNSRL